MSLSLYIYVCIYVCVYICRPAKLFICISRLPAWPVTQKMMNLNPVTRKCRLLA